MAQRSIQTTAMYHIQRDKGSKETKEGFREGVVFLWLLETQ